MNKCIVTIGRMFGSGGGEIARKTAELLGVKCYDKELIIKSAEASGISPEQLETVDERATNSFLYSLAMASYNGQIAGITGNDMIMSDRLFSVQSDIIRNIAGEGSAVIIGRCADDILAGCDGLLKVFVYAPLENRIKRIMEQHSLEESEAKALIKKTDKKRQRISVIVLKSLYEKLKLLSFEERMQVFNLKPDRADVIVPASEIFLTIAEILHSEYIYVPVIGLADGIIDGLYAANRNR